MSILQVFRSLDLISIPIPPIFLQNYNFFLIYNPYHTIFWWRVLRAARSVSCHTHLGSTWWSMPDSKNRWRRQSHLPTSRCSWAVVVLSSVVCDGLARWGSSWSVIWSSCRIVFCPIPSVRLSLLHLDRSCPVVAPRVRGIFDRSNCKYLHRRS